MAEFVGGRAYADRSEKFTRRTDKPIQVQAVYKNARALGARDRAGYHASSENGVGHAARVGTAFWYRRVEPLRAARDRLTGDSRNMPCHPPAGSGQAI